MTSSQDQGLGLLSHRSRDLDLTHEKEKKKTEFHQEETNLKTHKHTEEALNKA